MRGRAVPASFFREVAGILGVAILLVCALPLAASAQWNVVVTETPNPLPIGNCGSVYVTVTDPAARGRARNPIGQLVSIADFDMTATAPDPTAVVGVWNDPNAWSVCTCQVATIGMPVTITATYPAKLLPAKKRSPGVAIQQSFTFPVSKSPGTSNPAGCPPPPTLLASGPSTSAPPPGSVTAGPPLVAPGGAPVGTPVGIPVGSPIGTPATVPVGTPAGAPAAVPAGTLPTPPSTLAPTAPATPAAPAGVTAPPSGVAPSAPLVGAPATVSPGQAPPPSQPPTSGITPINPTKTATKELLPGTVQLWWTKVKGANYYVVTGAGSAYGGVQVTDTTYVVTNVPAGPQSWLVGSYYLPGPVSTPANMFAKAFVQSYGPAQTSTYRLIATGFRVVHETVDDAFDRDGLRNEVYASFSTFHFKDVVDYVLLDQDLRRTFVYGDNSKHPSRVRAGTASPTGGLRAGDAFPVIPTVRTAAVNDSGFPFKVWEGSLTDGQDFIVLLPKLWEWSGSSDNYDAWFPYLAYNAPLLWSSGYGRANWSSTKPNTLPFADSYAMGSAVTPPNFSAIGQSMLDRPIGIALNSNTGGFDSGAEVVVLTRKNIEAAFKQVPAGGPQRATMTVSFVDGTNVPSAGGNFILYFDIERVP